MSDISSANYAALRREARRKRILENSEKRLRSITGKPVSDFYEDKHESDTCFIHNEFQNVRETSIFRDSDRDASLERHVDREFWPLGTPLNFDDDVVQSKSQKDADSFWLRYLVRKRFHLIVSAIIVQLLYISKLGYLFYNNLFCPFITVKIMEFFLKLEPLPTQNQDLFTCVASMFKASTLIQLYKAYSVVSVIVSDFFLYIFIIVACDKFFNITISPYITW